MRRSEEVMGKVWGGWNIVVILTSLFFFFALEPSFNGNRVECLASERKTSRYNAFSLITYRPRFNRIKSNTGFFNTFHFNFPLKFNC